MARKPSAWRTLVCAECGEEFDRRICDIRKKEKRGVVHHFCSRACAYKSPLRSELLSLRQHQRRPLPSITLSDIDLGYLAGCVDADGCIQVPRNRNRGNPQLDVVNTRVTMLERLHRTTGVGSLYNGRHKRKPHHHDLWHWSVSAVNDLRVLLPLLIPALTVKRKQAELMLEFCERRAAGTLLGKHDKQIAAEVRHLNQSV